MGANPGTDAYVNCRTQVAGHRSSASAAIPANDLCQVWKRLGRPRIALELEERIRKALATPAGQGCASLPNSSLSIPVRCSVSAALSTAA